EGLGLVDQKIGSKIILEDKGDTTAKQVLSDAAMYVYHRASEDGCRKGEGAPSVWYQNNKKGGYPGLRNTYLTAQPPCAGLSSKSGFRGVEGALKEEGYDMEGVFSRVSFKIPEDREKPIVLTKGGGTWLEDNYLAASKEGFYEKITRVCRAEIFTAAFSDSELAKIIDDAYTAYLNNVDIGTEIRYFGTGSKYSFFFKPKDVGNRASVWMSDKGLTDGIYCGLDIPDAGIFTGPAVKQRFEGKEVKVTLCPGDEGYIQLNKGFTSGDGPWNKVEAGEDISGYSSKYPFIQITKLGKDCTGS
ncbi:MAG: hypothetical protein ABEJ72_06845, partial [Candidatus Aenigmatarchaeota archaeon]